MKKVSEIVESLIDELINYVDSLVVRQRELSEMSNKPCDSRQMDEILNEMTFIDAHSKQIAGILRSKMKELMNSGYRSSDEVSCECETGKVVNKHSPTCKWMIETFGDDI